MYELLYLQKLTTSQVRKITIIDKAHNYITILSHKYH